MGRSAIPQDDKVEQLLEGIDDEQDPRVAWGAVDRHIKSLREEGRDVPEVLVKVERRLRTDLAALSQGR